MLFFLGSHEYFGCSFSFSPVPGINYCDVTPFLHRTLCFKNMICYNFVPNGTDMFWLLSTFCHDSIFWAIQRFARYHHCCKRGEAKGDRQKSDQKHQKMWQDGDQKVTETAKNWSISTSKKRGFLQRGRVQCHGQGNKKYPRVLGPAAHLALGVPQPREKYIFAKTPF